MASSTVSPPGLGPTSSISQPSGYDGEGQARGQARNARGEHGQPSEGCHPYSRFVSLETGEMPHLRLRRRPSRDIKNYPVPGYIYPPPAKAYVRNFPQGFRMVYLLFFLIPIVLLLAWVSWSTGSGVGLETWVMTSMWRHRLHGGTRNADDGMGCRTLIPDRQYYASNGAVSA